MDISIDAGMVIPSGISKKYERVKHTKMLENTAPGNANRLLLLCAFNWSII